MHARTRVVILIGASVLLFGKAAVAQENQTQSAAISSAHVQTTAAPAGDAASGPSQDAHPLVGARPVENYVKYRFFFQHLQNIDNAASQFESQGKQTGRFREFDQDHAKLTDAEGQVIKQIAYDCNKQVSEVLEKRKAVIASMRAQYPNKPLYKVPQPPELKQLDAERLQIINSHIDQLKTRLGDASFQKLDVWVQSRYRSAISIPATGPGVGVKAGQPASGASR